MVVLDTNVIIDHLRQPKGAVTHFKQIIQNNLKEALAISMISIQELYEGKSTLSVEKEKFLLATISHLLMLPYTFEVAQLAGTIARDRKRPIDLADAAIAATVIINDAKLFTLDKKDFWGIKNLDFLNAS